MTQQNFMSARALAMEELENVNGGYGANYTFKCIEHERKK